MTPEEFDERIRQLEESVKHLSSTEREVMDKELRDLERQPVLACGNARRLEETVEESEP